MVEVTRTENVRVTALAHFIDIRQRATPTAAANHVNIAVDQWRFYP